VVSVERSPSAVAALHTDDPLSSTRDGIMELRPSGFGKLVCPIHRHNHNCGIIQINVIWIDVLERPAARTHMGASFAPIADPVKNLQRFQPTQTAHCFSDSSLAAYLHHGLRREGRVPDW